MSTVPSLYRFSFQSIPSRDELERLSADARSTALSEAVNHLEISRLHDLSLPSVSVNSTQNHDQGDRKGIYPFPAKVRRTISSLHNTDTRPKESRSKSKSCVAPETGELRFVLRTLGISGVNEIFSLPWTMGVIYCPVHGVAEVRDRS